MCKFKTYRYRYLDGYLVYKAYSDVSIHITNSDEYMRVHKAATFVTESEASDYCEYRNSMLEKHGTDDVDAIEHNPPVSNMRTISAEKTGNAIYTLVFEHHDNGTITVLDDEVIPSNDQVPQFTGGDALLVRLAYPNLAADTKLFVCQ